MAQVELIPHEFGFLLVDHATGRSQTNDMQADLAPMWSEFARDLAYRVGKIHRLPKLKILLRLVSKVLVQTTVLYKLHK